jgi:hypothetical protein
LKFENAFEDHCAIGRFLHFLEPIENLLIPAGVGDVEALDVGDVNGARFVDRFLEAGRFLAITGPIIDAERFGQGGAKFADARLERGFEITASAVIVLDAVVFGAGPFLRAGRPENNAELANGVLGPAFVDVIGNLLPGAGFDEGDFAHQRRRAIHAAQAIDDLPKIRVGNNGGVREAGFVGNPAADQNLGDGTAGGVEAEIVDLLFEDIDVAETFVAHVTGQPDEVRLHFLRIFEGDDVDLALIEELLVLRSFHG